MLLCKSLKIKYRCAPAERYGLRDARSEHPGEVLRQLHQGKEQAAEDSAGSGRVTACVGGRGDGRKGVDTL